MSSKTMSLVGVLGLLATGANAATVQSSNAVSAPTASSAKLVAAAARPQAGCTAALVKGHMPKLSTIRKAKTDAACQSYRYMQAGAAGGAAVGGGTSFVSSILPGALISAGVGAGVAYGVSEANKNDNSPGGNN
jgi:hypothetical protein